MSEPTTFAEIFNSGYWEGMQQFADGTLQTDDGTSFSIHRVVLSPRSRYFRALFSFDLNKKTMVIQNVDSKVLECILVYAYTGTIKLNEKNVRDLLIASDYLRLEELLKICESFAIQNMTVDSCLPMVTVASELNRTAFEKDCLRYAIVHFEDILETSNGGLEELPLEMLKQLLQSNSLNIVTEKSVWKAIVSWTEADSSARLPHVPILLTYIRLEEGINENMEEEIVSHAIVSKNPHIFSLMLKNEFSFCELKHAILSQNSFLEPGGKNLPYVPRVPNRLHLFFQFTPTDTDECYKLFLSYDNELDFWRLVYKPKGYVDNMLRIGQRIYIFVNSLLRWVFDIVDEVLLLRDISDPPKHNPITRLIYLALKERLYCIESNAMIYGVSTNYIYRCENKIWKGITKTLNIARCNFVTFKDKIFAVGGSYSDKVMICRAYDPEKDTWLSLSAPNIFRKISFALASDEKVFVISGEGEERPKEVEVYDPIQNTWTSLPDLPVAYIYPHATILEGKLIVYEKHIFEEDRKLSPPVYWDEDGMLWRTIDESSPWYHIVWYSFFVLDDCSLVKDITAKNRVAGNEWKRIFPV